MSSELFAILHCSFFISSGFLRYVLHDKQDAEQDRNIERTHLSK